MSNIEENKTNREKEWDSRISQIWREPQNSRVNLLFGIIFDENCMKMKILDWRGDASLVPILEVSFNQI